MDSVTFDITIRELHWSPWVSRFRHHGYPSDTHASIHAAPTCPISQRLRCKAEKGSSNQARLRVHVPKQKVYLPKTTNHGRLAPDIESLDTLRETI